MDSYPVKTTLKILLQDKTTRHNIIWATDAYEIFGRGYCDKEQITPERLIGVSSITLQPRICKSLEDQQARTRKKAEVFTPVWLCNKMNNYCDEEWFGRKDVFNVECSDNQWDVVDVEITFPEDKTWKEYILSRRLEITCGEAPFLVSRYDAATGELILPPFRRIGILDRKLRVVNENTKNENDWLKWAIKAFESCYGYEYQGDNLLIARINLIMTFYDYYTERWQKEPDEAALRKVAMVISWNIWQMDGLKDTTPLGMPYEENRQMSIFDYMNEEQEEKEEVEQVELALPCKIMIWTSHTAMEYKTLKELN